MTEKRAKDWTSPFQTRNAKRTAPSVPARHCACHHLCRRRRPALAGLKIDL
jgi:hypothetical protein